MLAHNQAELQSIYQQMALDAATRQDQSAVGYLLDCLLVLAEHDILDPVPEPSRALGAVDYMARCSTFERTWKAGLR